MGKIQSEEYYNRILKIEWGRYSKGPYAARDKLLADMLRPHNPVRVIEVCGAEGYLAKLLVDSCPTIQRYLLSDFSAYAIERMKPLASPKLEVRRIDVDKEYGTIDFYPFDTFICTALEHVQFDRELLSALEEGTTVALSLPTTNAVEHIRFYPTFHDVETRYSGILKILEKQEYPAGKKLSFIGVKLP